MDGQSHCTVMPPFGGGTVAALDTVSRRDSTASAAWGRLAGSLGTRALVERMLWRLEAEEARQQWHEVLLREQRRAQRFQLLEREEMLWRREGRKGDGEAGRRQVGQWFVVAPRGELNDTWGLGAGRGVRPLRLQVRPILRFGRRGAGGMDVGSVSFSLTTRRRTRPRAPFGAVCRGGPSQARPGAAGGPVGAPGQRRWRSAVPRLV